MKINQYFIGILLLFGLLLGGCNDFHSGSTPASGGNTVPIANAGVDQNVNATSVVTLDGSASSDVDVGDTLTYLWSITSVPAGSTAALSNPTAVDPIFTADLDGAYVLTLIVNDGTVDSTADTVTVNAATANSAPVANAGIDQNVATTSVVTLDGSASSDVDVGDTLTYLWSITSVPAGSTAALSSATVVNPTFTVDLDGAYVLTLIVNDGTVDSTADTVTINAATTITHNGTTYDTVTSPYTGKIWLDRNLGASQVCTTLVDTACYGDYYQWGRNYDGHQQLNSPTTATLSADINNAGPNFITTSTSPNDWASVDSDGALRAANWGATDGSSVCPTGFRVPTTTELRAETVDNSAGDAFANNTDAFNNFLKLPSAGYRLYADIAAGQDDYGVMYSSGVFNNDSSDTLTFSTSGASTSFTQRANGLSVRCIQD